MSLTAIRGALQLRLSTLTPAIQLVYENDNYTPLVGTPYADVTLMPAESVNPEFGDPSAVLVRWTGILQVLLKYPGDSGWKPAADQAALVQARFRRGLSLTSGGVTTIINKTPSIHPGFRHAQLYVVPVSIYWFAHTFT